MENWDETKPCGHPFSLPVDGTGLLLMANFPRKHLKTFVTAPPALSEAATGPGAHTPGR